LEQLRLSANPKHDAAAHAKTTLAAAYQGLVAASKVAVGDDGRTLLMAAAAVDLAIEHLTPPTTDAASAASSCREAHALLANTRAYAPGGNIAVALDAGRQKLDEALLLLQAPAAVS
jgi:hypothetical protein